MQTVVSPLTTEVQNHTAPQSLMKSYKIKSKNLTFSLTRGPGSDSATITNGLMGQIEMKVVNETHVQNFSDQREGGRQNEWERKRPEGRRERERRLVVRWKCLFSHFRVPSSVCVCLRSTDLVMNNLFHSENTFCETQQSSVETLQSTDWGVLNCNSSIYCEAREIHIYSPFRRCPFYLQVST